MVAAFRSLALVICSLLFVAPVLAQQQASISGKLIDPDGLVLPGATVTVSEQNTGFSRNVVTAETGAYTVPNLTPGTYTVTVEMPGFGSLKRTDVLLTAGSEMVIDLKMQVGGVQEQVTVSGSWLPSRQNHQLGSRVSAGWRAGWEHRLSSRMSPPHPGTEHRRITPTDRRLTATGTVWLLPPPSCWCWGYW